jgi:membrane protease YdiL (CAAX protease family)
MDALISSLALTCAIGLVFLAASAADRRVAAAFAVLAAVYLGLDDLVTGLPNVLHLPKLPGARWNWSGKILSLLLSAVVIAALRLSPAAVGLKRPQHLRTLGAAALAVALVWGACLGLLFKPGQASPETLAFQATMPGLAEELVYRGIAPAILLGLMRRREPGAGVPWSVVIATSFAFGLWHGLGYSRGSLSFEPMSAVVPFVGSFPIGWLRFRTDSLVLPVLVHGVANVAFHVAGGLAA